MVIKEKLEISKELQRRINNLGKFNGQKIKLIEGSIITVPKTNIAYIEPYKVEIDGDTYLIFGKNEIKKSIDWYKSTCCFIYNRS